MHVRTVSSQISSLHRLIRDDILRFWKSILSKNPVKAESVVPDYPIQTAQANLGHFTHMHYAQFYQFTTHGINTHCVTIYASQYYL